MKQLTIVICTGLVALVLWRTIEHISSDALGLAIGVVFGVIAGLPTALLVLATKRQMDDVQPQRRQTQRALPEPNSYIVVLKNGTETHRVIDADRIEVRR